MFHRKDSHQFQEECSVLQLHIKLIRRQYFLMHRGNIGMEKVSLIYKFAFQKHTHHRLTWCIPTRGIKLS